jgi:UDP-glucose 4-epimerase
MSRSPKVLLIGALGYIGSRLLSHLRAQGHDVTPLDRAAPAGGPILPLDCRDLGACDLQPFGTVIWLAGHSSVKLATEAPADAFDNNVSGLLRLAQRLQPQQRLIYASSASLYSGNESPDHAITEEVIGFQYQNAYDLSKYAFDKLISTLDVDFCGLRFGTVCGTSPNQRHELLLNSMVRSAVSTGTVQVSNPGARRSVLAMNDLLATLSAMLEVVPPRGFYNLASYSMGIGEFGRAVASQLCARIVETPGSGTYTFSVDSSKICAALGRPLKTTLPALIEELAAYYDPVVEQPSCSTSSITRAVAWPATLTRSST